MKKKIRLSLGYVFYNLVFWGYYLIHWLRQKANRFGRLFFCNFLGICKRDIGEILIDHYKKIVFITYFGKNDYRSRVSRQEIFTSTTSKLAHIHRSSFGYEGVRFKSTYDFSLKDTNKGIVFISFHTISAYRRIINIARRFDIDKIGIVVKDRTTFTDKLLKNYGVSIPEGQGSFVLEGIVAEICSLQEVPNPAKRHSKLVQMLKEGTSLFINYDIPTSQEEEVKELFNDFGQLKKPSKYYTFKYNNQKILVVSKYLLYLLKQSGAIGLPVFTRRLKDGRDIVVLGNDFSVERDEKINDQAPEIFDNLFSFMSKNVLASSCSWVNASNLARLMPFLRKSETSFDREACSDSNVSKAKLRLSSYVLINRYNEKSYIITSTSPIKSLKVCKLTKDVVAELKSNGAITQRLTDSVSRKKLDSVLVNLWEAGIIEEAD